MSTEKPKKPEWDPTAREYLPPQHSPETDIIGIPPRIFLYTLDQVAQILVVSIRQVRYEYAHFDGRTVGLPDKDRIVFRNIAPRGADPEWRTAERELIRFLKHKGYKYYERGWVSH